MFKAEPTKLHSYIKALLVINLSETGHILCCKTLLLRFRILSLDYTFFKLLKPGHKI